MPLDLSPQQADEAMELIYSPDDAGYYWQRFSDWKTSQVFKTRSLAERAKAKGKLRWS